MNQKNEVSRSSFLQEMVKVKKIRFTETESRKYKPKLNHDLIQRKANFEEFKAVYEDSVKRLSNASIAKGPYVVHKTKSGSIYRFPSFKKEPQFVETINVELPLHYGADRAVQLIENKIKPKTSSRAPKVNREVITENAISKSSFRSQHSLNKPKKSVTIVDKLTTIEETAREQESITTITESQFKEIQTQLKNRKERVHMTLPKTVPVVKTMKKKPTNDKIMNALSNINEKLQKMQEKYFTVPRVQYKNVNDCFTQSGNFEVLYENEQYPEKVINDAIAQYGSSNDQDGVLSDSKMQERIKEMKDLFPEFPKIEDTLKEIEAHLENIVNLEAASNHQQESLNNFKEDMYQEKFSNILNGGNLTELIASLNEETTCYDSMTEEILKQRKEAKEEKLKTIRQQIDDVEDFCDRLSEIANEDENIDTDCSAETFINQEDERNFHEPYESSSELNKYEKTAKETEDHEGFDLQSSIKKSNYLSKEFNISNEYAAQPMVKIFSENRRICWRNRMREAKKQNQAYSVESVTKMIDSLKFTLENSIYNPVT